MTDILDSLRDQWKDASKQPQKPTFSADEIILAAQRKMRQSMGMHLGNAGILLLTLVGLLAFFYWVAPFRTTLSHIGMTLMMGGLAIRILIEFYSLWRTKQLDLSATATEANEQFQAFYAYRKRIHGSVTITILVGYSIGFYLLVPEFSQYVDTRWVILFATSYVPILAFIGYSIRTAIRREMGYLNEISNLKKELEN